MKSTEDRRCPTAVRVNHTALVDICSLQEQGAPFQGQSYNISGRGMHVRGSYLPEVGEALVCRFHHDEAEVLVEGRVAWRSEGEDSGEFGIQFTALDADSADLLRGLGRNSSSDEGPRLESKPRRVDAEEDDGELARGQRVRLHIEGLGAPMKGSVRDGSTRKVKVGSALEFLKMGRKVELEDVEGGQRRGAMVDSVNVVIHPTTSVPELVVQLRYEGVEPTPVPARAAGHGGHDSESVDPHSEEAVELEDDEDGMLHPTAEALRERLGSAVSSAGRAAQQAGGLLSSWARSGKERVFSSQPQGKKKTTSKSGRAAALSSQPPQRRRFQSTARPSQRTPSHLRSGIHDLNLSRGKDPRRSRPAESSEPSKPQPKSKSRRAAWFALGAFVIFAGSAIALRSVDSESAAKKSAGGTKTEVAAATQDQPPQVATQRPKTLDKSEEEGQILAEVPLFGPQAVAKPALEVPLSKMSDAEAERRAAAASVADQTFDEPEAPDEVEDQKPWGRGRMYLPTIHRIRLDAAGKSIAGAINSDGFTVVIPGRKVMESGKAIQKRDKRIVAVNAMNEGPNAKVRFEFRGPVPPYRVRLRQDFVEFLISAPEESVAQL